MKKTFLGIVLLFSSIVPVCGVANGEDGLARSALRSSGE